MRALKTVPDRSARQSLWCARQGACRRHRRCASLPERETDRHEERRPGPSRRDSALAGTWRTGSPQSAYPDYRARGLQALAACSERGARRAKAGTAKLEGIRAEVRIAGMGGA